MMWLANGGDDNQVGNIIKCSSQNLATDKISALMLYVRSRQVYASRPDFTWSGECITEHRLGVMEQLRGVPVSLMSVERYENNIEAVTILSSRRYRCLLTLLIKLGATLNRSLYVPQHLVLPRINAGDEGNIRDFMCRMRPLKIMLVGYDYQRFMVGEIVSSYCGYMRVVERRDVRDAYEDHPNKHLLTVNSKFRGRPGSWYTFNAAPYTSGLPYSILDVSEIADGYGLNVVFRNEAWCHANDAYNRCIVHNNVISVGMYDDRQTEVFDIFCAIGNALHPRGSYVETPLEAWMNGLLYTLHISQVEYNITWSQYIYFSATILN